MNTTPRIPDSEIDEFLQTSKSEHDDSVRCRQIISQLRQDLNAPRQVDWNEVETIRDMTLSKEKADDEQECIVNSFIKDLKTNADCWFKQKD